MGAVTLTITFLMNVLPAVVQQRSRAAYITDMGGTPRRILERAWNGENLDSLHDHVVALTPMLHLFTDYAYSISETDESRRFFAGLLRDDGWPWDRIHDSKPYSAT